MLRHEGKLTALRPMASRRSPATWRRAFAHQRRTDRDGLSGLEGDERKNSPRSARATTARRSRPRSRRSSKTSPFNRCAGGSNGPARANWHSRAGCSRNVRLNRLLAESLPLDEVFVFPAMGDDGLPVGAGLSLLHARDGTETWLRHRHRPRQCLPRAELRRPHR